MLNKVWSGFVEYILEKELSEVYKKLTNRNDQSATLDSPQIPKI